MPKIFLKVAVFVNLPASNGALAENFQRSSALILRLVILLPALSLEEKRINFAQNGLEQDAIKSFRDRNHKCYAIALLGYCKIKPIPLNPSFKALREDLTVIADEYLPNYGRYTPMWRCDTF